MQKTNKFQPALWIADAPLAVQSIERWEALAYLRHCPNRYRDARYQAALEMLELCVRGSATIDQARDAFRTFALSAMILAEADIAPQAGEATA